MYKVGFLRGLAVKNPPANAGDSGSVPGSRRFPEKGKQVLYMNAYMWNLEKWYR